MSPKRRNRPSPPPRPGPLETVPARARPSASRKAPATPEAKARPGASKVRPGLATAPARATETNGRRPAGMGLHTSEGLRKYLTSAERDAFLGEAERADRAVRTLCMTLA